jgi:predicted nucleic acid-binding protein
VVVVDNNILSSLAKIDRLDWLPQVFDTVMTTPSVLDELHRDAVAGYAFVDRIDTVKAYNDGWLRIATPTEAEIERTETILDVSLSFTDAECIAVAATRDTRLLTDDRHVGEIASQHAVTVWDLPLFLEACIHTGVISSEAELDAVLDDLVEQDFYRFAADDRAELYGFFEE